MFSEEVTRKDGSKVTVSAKTEDELKQAVKVQEGMVPATYPNINVPVAKGHDLIDVDEALNVKLVDGTGAHNSPNDAVNEDGSLEGDPTVASPGAGEAPSKAAGSGEPVGEPTIAEPESKESLPQESMASGESKS